MAEKKKQNKFTIQFNPGDPAHRQVIEILNQQGRRKAQFIVNAVQHYLHCPETPEIPQIPPTDIEAIEVIVRRIMEEQNKRDTESNTIIHSQQSENIQCDENVSFLGQDGMAAIANTIAMFRRG